MSSASTEPREAVLEREIRLGGPPLDLQRRIHWDGQLKVLLDINDMAIVINPESGEDEVYQPDSGLWVRACGTAVPIPGGVAVTDGSTIQVRRGRPTRVSNWRGHSTPINVLMAAPGPMIVSASRGDGIRFWDAESGEQVRIALVNDDTTDLSWYIGLDGRVRVASAGQGGVLRIWDPQLPAPALVHLTKQVHTRGFSDRVANWDLLDRRALIDTLAETLRPDFFGTGPTVLTVEGPWGSGKSSLMELVKAELSDPAPADSSSKRLTVARADRLLRRDRREKSTEEPRPKHAVVAGFNPWRHQSSEQVWAGLARAITDTAMRAMFGDDRAACERYWFTRNVERVDRRHVLRELRKRILSPLLALGVLGFGVSLLAAVTKLTAPSWWLVAIPAAPLVCGIVQTAWRHYRTPASRYLPGELFAGPALSEPTDPSVHDPYYHARSGYLYLVQHDIAELLTDLAHHGEQLVVMIDDLDRCTPRTTAEVFEAINVFLSDTFPRTRFVLGLDPIVVASHIDHAYRELADAKVVTHPDDPSPGWTFLRKLVQLPVRVPRMTADKVDRVLRAQLGAVHNDEKHVRVSEYDPPPAIPDPQLPAPYSVADSLVIQIEQHPQVREYLRQRLVAQPEHTVREEKRLINVWQFYLRVLASSDIDQACHLVVLAEIVTRWPAYQHLLRGNWQTLADAVTDDLAWGTAIAKIGFKYPDRQAAENLRTVLAGCDAQAVAGLANRLF
ncbi:hypothetical protein FXN61_44585 [Lentzea sp. PSKA42]|uniref:KAP NTPase domain-containing protein n=1 Tax=Lentzea indica TaxID=2604800 RepID=A0ABX1FX45_9PSEU|nr:P-loop NTPase fold protein [Lentzea indica]NKE63424.1 hypothetical protein [Lentzea indica]